MSEKLNFIIRELKEKHNGSFEEFVEALNLNPEKESELISDMAKKFTEED